MGNNNTNHIHGCASESELNDIFRKIRMAKEEKARGINAEIDAEQEEKQKDFAVMIGMASSSEFNDVEDLTALYEDIGQQIQQLQGGNLQQKKGKSVPRWSFLNRNKKKSPETNVSEGDVKSSDVEDVLYFYSFCLKDEWGYCVIGRKCIYAGIEKLEQKTLLMQKCIAEISLFVSECGTPPKIFFESPEDLGEFDSFARNQANWSSLWEKPELCFQQEQGIKQDALVILAVMKGGCRGAK